MSNYVQLKQNLKNLKLTGMAEILEIRIEQAEQQELGYTDLISLLVDDELERRRNRKIERLLTRAKLKGNQTLETFDFKANQSITPVQIKELGTLHFMDKAENIFFIGPTGVGKTHLAKAIGHIACRKHFSVLFHSFTYLIAELTRAEINGKLPTLLRNLYRADLLIIDDFAFKKITPQTAEYMYSIVDERYQNKSTVFTSNRSIMDWMEIFPDPVMANAIMDRIAHNAQQIIIKGDSFRKRKALK